MRHRRDKHAFGALAKAAGGILSGMFACALACVLAACGSSEEGEQAPPPYYDWDCFAKDGQFYLFEAGGMSNTRTGIDVSESQGYIDWPKVAESGVKFAFIRVGYRGSTEGGLYLDDCFSYNIDAAREAGIECGAYFFSQAVSAEEAREEAAFVLDALDGVALDYPVVFDYEMRASGINSRVSGVESHLATSIAAAYCEAVEAAGYGAMLYGNGYDLGHYDLDALDSYPIWYAEYGALPAYPQAFAIWQYASDGQIDGIDTPVDLSLQMSAL